MKRSSSTPAVLFAAGLVMGAALPAIAGTSDCEAAASKNAGHYWWSELFVENYTRKDVHLVIRQAGQVLLDRTIPGEAADEGFRREHPLKDEEPFRRRFAVRFDDRVPQVEIERLTAPRSKEDLSVAGLTKRPDFDFRLSIRNEGLELRQDVDQYKPADGENGAPEFSREEFQQSETARRREGVCLKLFVKNHTKEQVHVRVTADGRDLFDDTLSAFDPAPRPFSWESPRRPYDQGSTAFRLDPATKRIEVEEDLFFRRKWTFSYSDVWQHYQQGDVGHPFIAITESGAELGYGADR